MSKQKLNICNLDGEILFSYECQYNNLKKTLEEAVRRRIDLTGADLGWADLKDADLTLARLKGAKLVGANLRSATLKEADLKGANLRWANLTLADLKRADLSGADLKSADLSGADLKSADLTLARLKGIQMSGHTPGPWIDPTRKKALQVPLRGLNCEELGFEIVRINNEALFEEAKANAQLIGATTDLLEALKGLLSAVCEGSEPALDAAKYAAQAVIARATGVAA
jgi:uncharacterized protein YjbI with pentapeptide repeats